MKHLKEYSPIIIIFCLALLVRITYNLTIARDYTPIFDAALYNNIAQKLVDEHCFCLYTYHPAVSRPPLWPFIIAVIYLFAGKQEFFARLFLCFLGSGTCVLIYIFAKDLFGRHVALFTGTIAAIYTGLFIYDGWLYSESLYTFCLLMFTYSLYRLQNAPLPSALNTKNRCFRIFQNGRWIIVCGVFLGFLALTRPNGLIVFGLVYAWAAIVMFAKIVPWRVAVRSSLIITCIAAIMVAPWSYRNYVVSHAFVPVSTGTGEVLSGVYNNVVLNGSLAAPGMWEPPLHSISHDAYAYTPADDKADTARALSWIHAHLTAMPYLLGLHFINTWIPYTYSHGLPFEEFPTRPLSIFMFRLIPLMSIPIFFLAALGLLLTWKQHKKRLLVVYLVIGLTIVQNIVTYGDMRFRAPIEPLLVLLTGGVLWWLMSRQGFKEGTTIESKLYISDELSAWIER